MTPPAHTPQSPQSGAPGPLIPARTRDLLSAALHPGGPSAAALGVVTSAGERGTLRLGEAQRDPQPQPLPPEAWWDLASLTKPLFTAREILRAAQDGLLDLDDPVGLTLADEGLPEGALSSRTLRQLLTHTAGLDPWAPLHTWGDAQAIRARLLSEPWTPREPGDVVYSDLGYMLLGRVLERVRGASLRDFPLDPGLSFTPEAAQSVATERCAWRGRMLRGETHDENAAALGGVAGHAGLFGTLDGVLAQAEQLLRGGWLSPAAQTLALAPQVPGRTLALVHAQPGWSGGSLCSPHAAGHTGFTGTGLWIDPPRGLAWVLLTNRVHPTRHSGFDIQALRRAVGNTLQAAHTGR